jgi:hypothetical protein
MKKKTPSTTPNGLSMRWVPVTASDGHRHLEMRWSAPPTVQRRSA